MWIKRMQISLSGFHHISSHISHHHHNLLENNLQIHFQILSTAFTWLYEQIAFSEIEICLLEMEAQRGPFSIYLFLPFPFPLSPT